MNVVEKAFGKNMCTCGLSKVGSHPSALETYHGSLASETVIVLQAVGGGRVGGCRRAMTKRPGPLASNPKRGSPVPKVILTTGLQRNPQQKEQATYLRQVGA